MQLSNYHSHCTFCDGRSTPEDFVKFAISHGFRAYGFSSHSPLPFETFWNMSKDDMPEYLEEINRLKEKYAGQLEIYTSLEIDYLDETYNPSIAYFQELPLDYRIGSIHFLPLSEHLSEDNMVCIDGAFADYKDSVDRYFEGKISKLVTRYFDSTLKMIEAGGIDIVGHMDKIYMNGHKCEGFSFDADWYQKPFNAVLDLIAQKELMVEVNTKNLIKKQQIFPRKEYLGLLKNMNIPVMVNSDCHYPDLVNDGRSEAFEILKEIGFRTTRELIKGNWQDVAI
ncbi:histidinol-phosphatase [Parabacteroides gordonii]|jgi:histidinol-phosphatase (PHP family)|uniref:Histidinol-phosphatase n=1 Tax=Parabacteroides gordonii MS-1 = DSM 23371 TaxID=1203610 RepID=A0A0F5J9R3_9BACT|nr:histidinol-phosphatase [Parabacteroides gordonii]KKB54152.1 HisJ family histidinol phosphate phosphatase [Parabacteroides gordonii MS-1 = DSM 23371]MCA5584972.1 histidinol-phosphatase [Parabacteroides gordonii]RGP14247.1 histidinol-phosphatase HisJ family protein [Parabacteroides gordonii]